MVAKLEGHKGQISGVAFLPDGRLMSASYDGTARVWNVQSVTGDDGKAPSATSSTSGVKVSATTNVNSFSQSSHTYRVLSCVVRECLCA